MDRAKLELGADRRGIRQRALERDAAGERLIEHHAHGIPIGGRGERLRLRLLGRHEGERPRDLPMAALESGGGRPVLVRSVRILAARASALERESKVADDDASFGGRDEDVGRLQVAVQQVRSVQRLQAFAELKKSAPQPWLVERGHSPRARVRPRRKRGRLTRAGIEQPFLQVDDGRLFVLDDLFRVCVFPAMRADIREKVRPFDELHGEQPLALVGEHVVELDEVRVRQVREPPKLGFEAEERGGIESRQELDGDGSFPPSVIRAKHRARSASAEEFMEHEAFGHLDSGAGALVEERLGRKGAVLRVVVRAVHRASVLFLLDASKRTSVPKRSSDRNSSSSCERRFRLER